MLNKCECGRNKDVRAKRCRFCWTSERRALKPARLANEIVAERRKLRRLIRDNSITTPSDIVIAYIENHDGLCDICGKLPDGRHNKFNMDHDHIAGVFRGLLCWSCNIGLGSFKDDTDSLQLAVQYLREPPAISVEIPALVPIPECEIDNSLMEEIISSHMSSVQLGELYGVSASTIRCAKTQYRQSKALPGIDNRILNEEKVRFIRANLHISSTVLAKEYGVNSRTIRRVREGKAWAHVI